MLACVTKPRMSRPACMTPEDRLGGTEWLQEVAFLAKAKRHSSGSWFQGGNGPQGGAAQGITHGSPPPPNIHNPWKFFWKSAKETVI